jgi:hypothetical protein
VPVPAKRALIVDHSESACITLSAVHAERAPIAAATVAAAGALQSVRDLRPDAIPMHRTAAGMSGLQADPPDRGDTGMGAVASGMHALQGAHQRAAQLQAACRSRRDAVPGPRCSAP